MPVDLNDLEVLDAVVEHKSFTEAGRLLGLPTSAVSRRIARLEEAVGAKLLNRTSRSVGLTHAGRMFHERTRDLGRTVTDAVRALSVQHEAVTGSLRVTLPPDDGGALWPLFEDFLRVNPDVDIQFIHTLERVDLVKDDIDLALRGGPAPDTTVYAARKIFDSRLLLAASPGYLAAHGTPVRVEQLEQHVGIGMDPWAPNAIRRLDGDQSYVHVKLRNRLRANSLQTIHNAALAGLGIAPLLELTCLDDLRAGRLVEVLRGALPDNAPMWALAPLTRHRTAAVAALLDAVTLAAQRSGTIVAPQPPRRNP